MNTITLHKDLTISTRPDGRPILRHAGKLILLSKRAILSLLINNQNQIVSQAQLFRHAWQDHYMAANPRYILNEPGEGYIFTTD